ncbi:MAG: hypothetical protein ABFE08_06515 [Armatimonadia bacterium]
MMKHVLTRTVQAMGYLLVFYVVSMAISVVLWALVGGAAVETIQAALSWTGIRGDQQPQTPLPYTFICQSVLVAAAFGSSIASPGLGRWRMLLPVIPLSVIVLYLSAELGFAQQLLQHDTLRNQSVMLYTSGIRSLIISTIMSVPGVFAAAWLGAMLRPASTRLQDR